VIARDSWDTRESRVARNSEAVLALFAEADVRATFFILGWVAERHPSLIRRIAEAGHEIASHGYDHARVFTLDAKRFEQDLNKTRKILEDASGQKVTGYRAPSFSIDRRTPWAHPILAEQGYAYSSSVVPIAHDHYGWQGTPRFAWRPVAGSDLVEIPVTTARLAGRTLAAGGGGFFRLLPYAFSRWALHQVNREGHAGIIYFHPWELDPDQPFVTEAPIKSKIRHYSRLSAMAGKLRRLMRDFEFGRMDALVAQERANAVAPDAAQAA